MAAVATTAATEEKLGSTLIVNGGPDAAAWKMPW
jgi:hypothetical protein